ncbi:MAG: hypothetical protein JXL80_06845 [Planctomycetes bacterium]|nr:hypothetical protein [Planctomycetota bacterium]
MALIEVPSDGESSYNWSMVVRDVGDEAVPYLEPYQEGPEGQRATMLINEIRKGTAGFGPEM